jgi:hypothetical protein
MKNRSALHFVLIIGIANFFAISPMKVRAGS